MKKLFMPLCLASTFSSLEGCAPDRIASAVTGRQCNTAFLYDDEDFCSRPVGPPPPQPYCTTGFEGTNCYARPDLIPNVAHQTYEGPTTLTPTQNQERMGQ